MLALFGALLPAPLPGANDEQCVTLADTPSHSPIEALPLLERCSRLYADDAELAGDLAADEPTDRRRVSFLLTASYGATYGLLRRNGRGLYVTDLVERREFAYDLSRGVVGGETTVDHGLREVNQREIRGQVAEIARFFNVTR